MAVGGVVIKYCDHSFGDREGVALLLSFERHGHIWLRRSITKHAMYVMPS